MGMYFESARALWIRRTNEGPSAGWSPRCGHPRGIGDSLSFEITNICEDGYMIGFPSMGQILVRRSFRAHRSYQIKTRC
jgi:hypothetical protein